MRSGWGFTLWFLVFISLTLGAESIKANDKDGFTILKNLNEEWMVYDQNRNGYVPYILQTPLRSSSISFMLNLTENSGYTLRNCVQKGTSLFIDQEIVARFEDPGCYTYNIDSLHQVYKKESAFITIYNPSLNRNQIKTLIIDDVRPLDVQGIEKADVLNIEIRESTGFKNFFIIGFMLLLSILAALYNLYPKSFRDYFGIVKVFSFRIRDESIIAGRPVSIVNMVFIMMYCALLAFLLIVIWHQLEGAPPSFDFINLNTFSSLSLSWILFSLIVFFAILVKFLLISAMTSLFKMKELSVIHFFDFIRLSLMFMVFTLGIVSLWILSFPSLDIFNSNLILFFMFFLSFVIVLVLFFKLLNISSFRNVQLFSYLCTTEILPLLIGFKFFLNL